jgi:hypothetical protein
MHDPTEQADASLTSRFLISTQYQTCIISDNEAPVTISISNSGGVESYWFQTGPTVWDFNVTLSGPVDSTATATVTLGGNGDPGFVFGTDIFETSGTIWTVTFAPGQTQGLIQMHPLVDAVSDSGETCRMMITNFTTGGRSVSIGTALAVGTLNDS